MSDVKKLPCRIFENFTFNFCFPRLCCFISTTCFETIELVKQTNAKSLCFPDVLKLHSTLNKIASVRKNKTAKCKKYYKQYLPMYFAEFSKILGKSSF